MEYLYEQRESGMFGWVQYYDELFMIIWSDYNR